MASSLSGKFKLWLQHVLPHRLLSNLVLRATRVRWAPWKNLLIDRIRHAYKVDLTQAVEPDPRAYPHFNAFFTRALKPGVRAPDPDPDTLVMPADGRISQAGRLEGGRILQAKGQTYSAAELLGDEASAAAFADGSFFTVYLSPRDYHRVHMPWVGLLRETVHVPGRIFSVAPLAVEGIPRVFARNERLVCHFDCDFGPMAVVMVGAMLVSGVETVWNGVEIPPYRNTLHRLDYLGEGITLDRGAEMARFNMGSTVIVLLPRDVVELVPGLLPETQVMVGQQLGRVVARGA